MSFPSTVLYYFLKFFISIYVFLFQHVRYKKNKLKLPKEPVIFISNHHSDWDPIYLNCMFPFRTIPGLMHEEAFKSPFLRFLFAKVFRCVKRGSSKSDVTAIKELLKVKKDKRNIMIFPEGDIDFFGCNLPVEISIAKLLKKMEMTVVILSITGAHLRAPRWSHYPHHSRVTYSLNRIIKKDELNKLSNEEVYDSIIKGIAVNEMEFQKQAKIRQIACFRANWLELGLFMCPKCHKINTMKSHNNDFKCQECGFDVHFNKYSFFDYKDKQDQKNVKYLQTTTDWNKFQLEELKNMITNNDGTLPIIEESNLIWGKSDLNTFFGKLHGKAHISFYKDRLEMILDNKKIILNNVNIHRVFVQYKSTLEIIVGTERYRFCKDNKMFCAYLWMKCFEIIKEVH